MMLFQKAQVAGRIPSFSTGVFRSLLQRVDGSLLLLTLVLFLLPRSAPARTFPDRNTDQWTYTEWNVTNDDWTGNPYDVVATVTFRHRGSGETHATEMFYAGDETWKFRFTGTRTGTWTFTTSSNDRDLDGHGGTVNVTPNPGRDGFLTHRGNKFAVRTGEDGSLAGYVFNVYMNMKDNPKFPHEFDNLDDQVDAYCQEAKENGFEIIFVHVTNDWFELGANGHDEHESVNPDRTTFSRLERIVTRARRNGCRVMFWAWGDESRKWTPTGVGEGINGKQDRRLQRYVAARLGPISGWSLGYGFDLHEWVSKQEVRSWQRYMRDHFGWQHLLSARATDLKSGDHINGYSIEDTEQGDFYGPAYPDMSTIVDQLNSDTDNPHLYEERHAWRRWELNEVQTRRLVWRTVMAGGMGGWYGFYDGNFGSPPYPDSLKTAFRTHRRFWHVKDRFDLDLSWAGDISDGYALKSDHGERYVVYGEETESLRVDLSGSPGDMQVVAVDTNSAYNERDLNTVSPGQHTFSLPYVSDWVLSIKPSGDR